MQAGKQINRSRTTVKRIRSRESIKSTLYSAKLNKRVFYMGLCVLLWRGLSYRPSDNRSRAVALPLPYQGYGPLQNVDNADTPVFDTVQHAVFDPVYSVIDPPGILYH